MCRIAMQSDNNMQFMTAAVIETRKDWLLPSKLRQTYFAKTGICIVTAKRSCVCHWSLKLDVLCLNRGPILIYSCFSIVMSS